MELLSSLAGALVGGIGSMIGAKYGADRAQASADTAWQRSSEFAREMSGSAHQRQVADLRAAGLNPILSGLGGGGAGGMASAQMASTPDFGAAGGALGNSVQNVARFANDLRRTDADIRLADSAADKNSADAGLSRTSAALKLLEQDNVSTAKQKMQGEIGLNSALQRLRQLEADSREAALPGEVLTGKLEGSPAWRSLRAGGDVLKGLAHTLTLGMAFKGLGSAASASRGSDFSGAMSR